MNNLISYLESLDLEEPIRLLARESFLPEEISYSEIETLIREGRLEDFINFQEKYAAYVNNVLTPLWLKTMAHASSRATNGKVILSDSVDDVKQWIQSHGAELVQNLSDESRRAISNILFDWQSRLMNPRIMAQQIRPLINLNNAQIQANDAYRQKIYNTLLENGANASLARQRAEAAAIRRASEQHRYRAETILHTELATAYNQGADMGVKRAIRQGLMTRCAMIWSTAGTNRVCARCLALKDTVVGYTDEVGVTLPPLHCRCRCAIIYEETGEQPKTYRRFNDAKEANEYFGNTARAKSKPYGKWCAAITSDEKAAVVKYTSNYYKVMNGWLRGFRPDGDFSTEELKQLKKCIADCESALEKSLLPDNILVHRQAGSEMLKLYKKAPDGIFLDEGFTSTTPIKGSFTGDIDIEINVPAGRGAGMWVDPISAFKGENEFLLNRGVKFKVLEIDESGTRPKVKLEVLAREAKQIKKRQSNGAPVRSDKFTWQAADVKVKDKNGNWIGGDEAIRDSQ